MLHRIAALLVLLLLAAPAAAAPPAPRVRLETGAGPIVIELAMKQAPVTAANFLRYVVEKRFDGTHFYRAAPARGARGRGFIQGGVRRSARRVLPPIAHEPTSRTGLRHVDGTVSMAITRPGSAMGDFFIVSGTAPSLDAKGKNPGFAAFGRVIEGMDVVRRILGAPTVPNAGSGAMRGQYLAKPVPIISARRVR